MRGLSYLTLWSGLSCPPRPRVLQGRADTSPALAERLLSSQCCQRSPRAPPTRPRSLSGSTDSTRQGGLPWNPDRIFVPKRVCSALEPPELQPTSLASSRPCVTKCSSDRSTAQRAARARARSPVQLPARLRPA